MFRGEIWRLSTANQRQSADSGSGRLVVIVSSDALGTLPLKLIVPLTQWKEEYGRAPWMVRLPPVLHSGLDSAMAADALQVRSVSTARLAKRMGELPEEWVNQIAQAVALVMQGRHP